MTNRFANQIFARGSQLLMHLRGHDCLRRIIENITLEKPHYIRGTKLRKYIATVCQLYDLSEAEYDWLIRHLGHDICVHQYFYRLHEDAIVFTKVSRLLLAVNQGEENQFAGKQLQQIELKDLPPLHEEKEDKTSEKGIENQEKGDKITENINDQPEINICCKTSALETTSSTKVHRQKDNKKSAYSVGSNFGVKRKSK